MAGLVRIVVPGAPVAWARAGGNFGGKIQFFTKPKARKYVERVKSRAMFAMQGRDAIMTGPVSMRIMVSLPIPASWPKWKRSKAATGAILPTSIPDIDNYEKAALDALKGVVYVDDAQVTDMISTKRYAADPSLILTVAEIADAAGAKAGRTA